MKKLFTLMAAAVMAMAANATDYKADLSVTMAGMPLGTQPSTISVTEQGDGKYTLALNNFKLDGIGAVGNIVLSDVEGTADNNGKTRLSTSQTINITAGDDPSVGEKEWLGPKLGDVPVSVNADMTDDNLYAVIKIDGFGGIDVVFGDGGYQLPNSGFENFHTATYTDGGKNYTSQEPNAWHSFNSGVATGSASFLTKNALQEGSTSVSEDVRESYSAIRPNGTRGTKCVKLTSKKVLGFAANGTMTTGRLQAGSIDATNAANCSFLDMTSTDVDGNGDPFYTTLTSKPDALTVWVKFKQGQDLGDYKYATVSAVITDGTRYQDPEDQTYTNVVAKAQNAQIESNDFAWQQLTIPFDYASYASNNVEPQAILITISTNAHPGSASSDANNPDELYVDDIALVYNAGLKSLTIKGSEVTLEDGTTSYTVNGLSGEFTLDDIVAVSDGQGAYVTKAIETTDDGATVTITVTSNDYQTVNTWTINVPGVSTGIEKVETTTENGVQAIYTLDGRKVSSMNAKGVYIVRKADGTTVKVLKK